MTNQVVQIPFPAATEGHSRSITDEDIEKCIIECLRDPRFFRPLDPSRGIDWINAGKVLTHLVWEVAGLDYRKTTHSIELTEWLIENDPDKLMDLAQMIQSAIDAC
jgi:hypothetical protein